MNLQSFKNRNGVFILVCIVAAVLVYSIDVFKLNYRLNGWKSFGDSPVAPARLQYFIPDTPNLIGFKEEGSGETVSCALTLAYLETEAGKTYRCCDTGDRIACLAGNFSTDIPATDEACNQSLRELLGIPESLPGTIDYKVFGNCIDGTQADVAVTQIDSNGQIHWKFINVSTLNVASSALKCILAPALLGLAGWLIYTAMRGNPYKSLDRS